MVGAELIRLDAVIEPSSRWRFGGKLGAANWDKGERRIARGGGMCRWGGRWVGEGATCRSSSSPPINTSLLSRCTDTIGSWTGFRCFRAQESSLKLSCKTPMRFAVLAFLHAMLRVEIIEDCNYSWIFFVREESKVPICFLRVTEF